MLITKTEQAVTLYKAGEFKKALRIFTTFKLGLTKEEQDQLRMAAEFDSSPLYSQMGLSKEILIQQARAIIEAKWIK